MIAILLLLLTIADEPPSQGGKVHHFKRFFMEDGLSQSIANQVVQDQRGYYWIATEDGLNRFDGYRFKVYRHDSSDPTTIGDSVVVGLAVDGADGIWLASRTAGLTRFDSYSETAERFQHDPNDPHSIGSDQLRSILVDSDGALWIGRYRGLDRRDPETGRFTRYNTFETGVLKLYEDPLDSNILWLGMWGQGLCRFDKTTGAQRFFGPKVGPRDEADYTVNAISRDGRGRLWAGTQKGPRLVDERAGHYDRAPAFGFLEGDTQILLLDSAGRFWVGGYTGLMMAPEPDARPVFLNPDPERLDGRRLTLLSEISEDRNGVIWFCVMGGGVLALDPRPLAVDHYRHGGNLPVEHNMINDLEMIDDTLWYTSTMGMGYMDLDRKTMHPAVIPTAPGHTNGHAAIAAVSDGKRGLWLGTLGGGLHHYDMDSGKQERYLHRPEEDGSLANAAVMDLLLSPEEDDDSIWVASVFGGLLTHFSREKGVIKRYDREVVGDNFFWSLYSAGPGQPLWVGTVHGGLARLDRTSGESVVYHHEHDKDILPHNEIRAIYGDPVHYPDLLWLGTPAGLVCFDTTTGKGRMSTHKPLRTSVKSITADDANNLWLAASDGLVRYDPLRDEIELYNLDDGLQSRDFNTGSALAHKGLLYFGGPNGINEIAPEKQRNVQPPPAPLLIQATRGSEDLLSSEHTRRVLPWGHQSLQFTFAAPAASVEGLRYRYQLEGFDSEWIYTSEANRQVDYTNMPPGNYTFRVRVHDDNHADSPEEATVSFEILAPWWQTLPARLLALLALVLLVLGYLRYQRAKLKRAEHLNHQLQEVDRLKDAFLANTSHELRTPLNGIMGLVGSMIENRNAHLSKQDRSTLSLVYNSARRLTALVNDLLDFSKLEQDKMDLILEDVDLRAAVDVVLTLSEPLVDHRSVLLENHVPEQIRVLADENRLQQILHNLVGNAVKFTRQGSIAVSAEQRDDRVVVSVTDTGIGISPEQREEIFESFAQVEASMTRTQGGSGLGLTISRMLVSLHGGKLDLESALDRGSSFSFDLPLYTGIGEARPTIGNPPAPVFKQERPATPASVEPPKTSEQTASTFRLLVVDDDPINRKVVLEFLQPYGYQLTEAADGEQALKLVLEAEQPFDLILLDVMMPRLSGFEVCGKIRERFGKLELPIIFLTARTQDGDMAAGFNAGGSDYMLKPLSRFELRVRVDAHLQVVAIHRNLEKLVAQRTAELNESNRLMRESHLKLSDQEKLASLGTLVAGIAHEIKNPLNFVNNFAAVSAELSREIHEALQSGKALQPDVLADLLSDAEDLEQNNLLIREHGQRATGIINSMMALARGEAGQKEATDINALVTTFSRLAWQGVRLRGRDMQTDLEVTTDPAVGTVMVVQQGMGRVILNLVTNAVEAMQDAPEHHQPRVTVRTQDAGARFQIIVEDNGPGINDSRRAQIFNPFYTTKPAGSGNIGLGLSFCQDIVAQHGGDLTLESEPDAFTRFTVTLPKQSTDQQADLDRAAS